MKKIILSILVFSAVISVSAQVQRTPTPSKQRDSAGVYQGNKKEAQVSKKDIFRELDLTREQRGKLKEITQSSKAKKEAINSDEKLDENQKKQKLREIQKDQMKQVQSILTPEQKQKWMELRKQKKDNAAMDNDNN